MHLFLGDKLDVKNVLKTVRKDDTKAVKGENRGLEAGEEEGRQKDKYEQLDHRQGRTEKRMRCTETKIVSKTRRETKNQTEVTREMDYKREKSEGKSGVALSRQVSGRIYENLRGFENPGRPESGAGPFSPKASKSGEFKRGLGEEPMWWGGGAEVWRRWGRGWPRWGGDRPWVDRVHQGEVLGGMPRGR